MMARPAPARFLRAVGVLTATVGVAVAALATVTGPRTAVPVLPAWDGASFEETILALAQAREPEVLADQIALCEIPAPPFGEAERGRALAARFEALGLRRVRIDAVGNVIGERPGREPRPSLVLSAHLDTVFPSGTDVRVRRDGAMLRGPGITDDCRGLAVLLGTLRLLEEASVTTTGPIIFVGTVGEEGLGDLRGVRHLVSQELRGRVDRFVSIDGGGLTVTAQAVGSRRYRVTYRGPGGHSYGAFGMANPIHALGRAVAAVARLEVPPGPKSTFNVGRIGGGRSVNTIAEEAWMEVDLRSASAASLEILDRQARQAFERAARDENARWPGGAAVTLGVERVGDRPAGATPADDPIVVRALAASRAVGYEPTTAAGSTDANLPMSEGIPAIAIGGGGAGAETHSLRERFDTTDSWKGTARATLLARWLTDP